MIAVLEVLTIFLTLAALATFVLLGWQNRANEKIQLTFWSAVGFAIIGLLIAARLLLTTDSLSNTFFNTVLPGLAFFSVGALVTVALNLRLESRHKEFPVNFIFEKGSLRTLEMADDSYFSGTSHLGRWLVEQILSRDHQFLHSGDFVTKGTSLYNEVLLWVVLDILCSRYVHSWDVKISRFNLPYGTEIRSSPRGETPPDSEFTEWDHLKRIFEDSWVLTVVPHAIGKMAVPKGTKVTGNTELSHGEVFRRCLYFKNRFAQISITIFTGGGCRGIGVYKDLLNYSAEQSDNFWTATYIVTLSANFTRLLSGHPEMARYRSWVDGMFEELSTTLDSTIQWERQKERNMFVKCQGSQVHKDGGAV
ncbi:MAG: hypothetical protein IH977_15525 [Nitrospinae bacterium]|nr:hypothetical protein [Nitrospinota bacterium]